MDDSPAESSVSAWLLFRVFFRIGMLTFGGGIAMLSVIRYELHVKHGWLSDREFWDEVTVATSFPGVIAVNVAYMQGRRLCGLPGAVAGVLGVVLPSFCIILLIVSLAGDFITHPVASRFLRGAAAGVAAQLAFSSLLFLRQIMHDRWSLLAAAAAGGLLFGLGWHPLAGLLTGLGLRMLLPYHRKPPVTGGSDAV
ncbi:chromate transporter [Spirochaeta africana]|nr:chromate transporter [Spirochaeta africana]